MKGIFQVVGKRWFDKRYGNTYHSVEVFRNNKPIGKVPFEYGYEDQYRHTAFKLMQSKGYARKTGNRLPSGMDADFYSFMQYTRKNPNKILFNVTDVPRKKDL